MAGPSRSGGLAKGILGGLLAGGLVAMVLGGGLGALGGAGLVTALLQALLIGGLIWLALRLFRRRPTFAAAGAAGGAGAPTFTANPFSGAQPSGFGGATGAMAGGYAAAIHDLAITQADKETFEHLLGTVQQAFSREDYAALRACTTPEIMSYLAEELSANATQGLRNEVLGTELLDAEVAEAWSEHDADYATIAMHYQSIDVMRSRTTGAVVDGDPSRLTRTTELWTFVRDRGHPWRLSAIQEA
jgi:predicted lipid-binding transport protein (Tim44 family)